MVAPSSARSRLGRKIVEKALSGGTFGDLLHAILPLLLGAPSPDAVPFAHAWADLRGGPVLAAGSLDAQYPSAARIGGTLRFSHWTDLRSRLDLSWHRFDGQLPMHVLTGGAGFDWMPTQALPVELGASLGLFYVRSKRDSVPHLNDDGETEFGMLLRVDVPVWERGDWSLRLQWQQDVAWTKPHASVFAWPSLGISRRLW